MSARNIMIVIVAAVVLGAIGGVIGGATNITSPSTAGMLARWSAWLPEC